MHRLIIFDDGLGRLGPMTDLRAAFEVRTGVHTTAQRIDSAWPKSLAAYWTQPRLTALVAERADAPVNVLPHDEAVLLINGRWAMPDPSQQLEVGEALIEQATGHVVMALLRRADAEYFLRTLEGGAGGQLSERVRTETIAGGQRVLYRHPWDVIAMMKQIIPHDIHSMRLDDPQFAPDIAAVVGDHPIQIDRSAKVYPNVTLDAESGPILVEEHAVIRPGAVLIGPCAIGPHSTVYDRSVIKANTATGAHCRIAGEVGGTIMQGFSNKGHDGHLGDSWVGEWVNFGAGTTNSNLLNTYGDVTMRLDPDSPRQRTGLQFLGAIVGDHVKFAICTRLMTGSVIGTGAMIATTAPPPTSVRRFAWLTDPPNGERTFQLDKFLDIAKTVMGRRQVTPSAAYTRAINELHSMATTGSAAISTASR